MGTRPEPLKARACSQCGGERHWTGSRWRCSACFNAWQVRWRQGARPETLAKIAATQADYKKNRRTPEQIATHLAYQAQWRSENAEYKRAKERERYAANSAAHRAAKLAEYRRDPEPFLARNLLRKARRLAAVCEHGDKCVSTEFLRLIYANSCAYCGAPAQNADHVIPISRGGLHCRENIAPACEACNKSKHARDVHEWLAERLP